MSKTMQNPNWMHLADQIEIRAAENSRQAMQLRDENRPSEAAHKARLASAQRMVAADLRGDDTSTMH